MEKRELWSSKYFYGNRISEYGLKNGYVDYSTLAKAFDAVLNNDIMSKTDAAGIGYWDQESGFIDNSEQLEELEEKLEELEEKISAVFLEINTLEEIAEERKNGVSESLNDSLPENLEAKKAELETLEDEKAELEAEKETLEDEQDYMPEVFQWFIVSDPGAEILKEFNEIVYYNSELDMYLWGVTHYGTSWSYVLTNIKIDPAALEEKEA